MDEIEAYRKQRDEWQMKAMRFEKAMNQNNARAQKAEADLKHTRTQLRTLQSRMKDTVRMAMESAISLVLQGVDYDEAQKATEEQP